MRGNKGMELPRFRFLPGLRGTNCLLSAFMANYFSPGFTQKDKIVFQVSNADACDFPRVIKDGRVFVDLLFKKGFRKGGAVLDHVKFRSKRRLIGHCHQQFPAEGMDRADLHLVNTVHQPAEAQ